MKVVENVVMVLLARGIVLLASPGVVTGTLFLRPRRWTLGLVLVFAAANALLKTFLPKEE
jgi:hypothetical protein